jgi:hypothetical protein
MALYGIIMRWHQHTTASGEHLPTQDHYFLSVDADRYYEVSNFPIPLYTKDAEKQVKSMQERHVISMARRFFVYLWENQEVIFDGRLNPPVPDKDEYRTTGGLPEGVKYPRLAEERTPALRR